MELQGEILDDMFDLKPIFPEIYSIKPQILNSPPKTKMQLKSSSPSSWNNNNNNNNNPAKLISFDNSNTNTAADHSNMMDLDTATADYNSPTSDIINFNHQLKMQYSSTARTPSQAMDHVMAERKRRQNLSQLFISLSKAVPGLKKLDKASLLEDGISYLKSLQERVRVLEEEEERMSAATAQDSCSCPEIQVRISDDRLHVLIKIFCKKEMGMMSRIPIEIMEKMHLNVVDMRIMPFGTALIDITILAQMTQEVSVQDIVDHLHTLFRVYP